MLSAWGAGKLIDFFYRSLRVGYGTAKLVAVTMPGNASSASLTLVLVSESVLRHRQLAALQPRSRRKCGPQPHVVFPLRVSVHDRRAVSIVRHPFSLTPRIYSGFIAWRVVTLRHQPGDAGARVQLPRAHYQPAGRLGGMGSAIALSVLAGSLRLR